MISEVLAPGSGFTTIPCPAAVFTNVWIAWELAAPPCSVTWAPLSGVVVPTRVTTPRIAPGTSASGFCDAAAPMLPTPIKATVNRSVATICRLVMIVLHVCV